MSPLEIITTLVGIIGGGGGIIAWAKFTAEQRAVKERREREDDALVWDSKKELRAAADGMAQSIWERLGADLEQAGKRLDDARATIDKQQAEIQTLLERLSAASAALIEAERKLAVAMTEVDRKESVIVQLQAQVAALEATVTELRRQLADCAGSGGSND